MPLPALARLGLTCGLLAALRAPAFAGMHAAMRPAPPSAVSILEDAPPPTHKIAVNVVILAGSSWARGAVEQRVTLTREILSQCALRLDGAIIERGLPSGGAGVLYDTDRSEEPAGMGTVARLLRPNAGPTLFYVGRFEDNAGQGGTSRPPFTSQGRPEVDTAWIPHHDRVPGWQDAYHVDAHELVHVLADTGHSALPTFGRKPRRNKEDPVDQADRDGGLMVGNPALRSNKLAPELCDKMKRHPLAERL